MKIQAELSLYPLKTGSLEKTVGCFIEKLSRTGISVAPGAMSTLVAGENEEVFRAVSRCFAEACATDEVVLVAKFSNACPTETGSDHKKK